MMEGPHSPLSRRRSPPHVVFMVDTHMTGPADLPQRDHAAQIRFGILRILLYFYTCVDRRMTWGYQFFDSENSSSTLRMQNHFQELSTSSLDAFLDTLNGEIDVSSHRQQDKAMNTIDNETPFARLKQALAQALSDFQWTEIDFAYLASPGRLRRTPRSMRQMRNGPVEIRNHIYIISSIPQTYSDIMWYFQRRSESAVQTHLTREGDKMTIVKMMDNVAMELKKTLWDGFVDHRISLNWIDIGEPVLDECLPEDKDVRDFIGLSFHAIAQIFGGHLIPFNLLQPELTEQFGFSVQSILAHYTPKTINTTSDFVHSKKVATNVNKPTLLDEIQKYQMESNEAWNGELVLKDEDILNEDQLPIKFKLLVHNFLRSQWSHSLVDLTNTALDNTQSIQDSFANIGSMTGFLQLPASSIPLKWYQITKDTERNTRNKNLFLCTLEHSEDMKLMTEFETLLALLNSNQHVLIVRLEHRDSVETCKYAAIEPIAFSSATIGFLDCETEDLLACAAKNTLERVNHRVHGTTLFDPWSQDDIYMPEDNSEEPHILYDIECDLPKELEVAIVSDITLQSTAVLVGEHAIITSVEAEGTEIQAPSLLVADVKEDMPGSLEELQSIWISLYLQSLYLSIIDPEAIARQFQIWVSHLEHTIYMQFMRRLFNRLFLLSLQPSDILKSLKMLPMSFYDFDTKHKELCNASAIVTDELGNHLVEDEDQVLEKWKQTKHLDTKNLRILKIKDAQLQIVVMLKIMELEKRFMTLNKIDLPKAPKKRKKKKKPSADDFEQQLELYFDRLCIWDSMMDITIMTETTKPAASKNGPESSIMNLKTLCKKLSDIYRPILPDIIDKLWSRCGGEEEPLQSELDRSLLAGTSKDFAPEKGTRASRSKPMDMDARVKLLESRIRGPSSETMVTDAVWATQIDKKGVQPSSSNTSLLTGIRRHTSSTINLPFMKREIEMTKSLSGSSKLKPTAASSAPPKPSGSRRKIAAPRKIPMAVTGGENTETVVLRKRQVFSPTTPRTRAERDFGLRLARTPTNAPSNVLTSAKRSTETIDGPIISSPRKLMRTFSGSRSPSAQRHKSLPMSRMRLSPDSPSHNRIKQTKPTDLSSIMPKRDLFSSFLQASGSPEDHNKL